ncbi:hypothetical protein LTR72_002693 [Exophiala xenobiotica]|nr:hypothetical protein LTR72_002693 [Exophiala xenobiotica]KAK5487864.1 hypothetical protein LTR55_005239 [Exophiala xenobiotica]
MVHGRNSSNINDSDLTNKVTAKIGAAATAEDIQAGNDDLMAAFRTDFWLGTILSLVQQDPSGRYVLIVLSSIHHHYTAGVTLHPHVELIGARPLRQGHTRGGAVMKK